MSNFKYTRASCLDDWQRTLWDAAQKEIKDRVIEIHTPIQYHGQEFCSVCGSEYAPESLFYPCPTIQALGGEQ